MSSQLNNIDLHEIITVTPAAISHLKQLLAKRAGSIGFQLAVKTDAGCSGYRYAPSLIQSTPDEAYVVGTFDDVLIYVPESSIQYLQDCTIDCVEKALKQRQMIYSNPRADNVCGCGESFNFSINPEKTNEHES